LGKTLRKREAFISEKVLEGLKNSSLNLSLPKQLRGVCVTDHQSGLITHFMTARKGFSIGFGVRYREYGIFVFQDSNLLRSNRKIKRI